MGQFGAIWDRGSLVAINVNDRDKYVEQIVSACTGQRERERGGWEVGREGEITSAWQGGMEGWVGRERDSVCVCVCVCVCVLCSSVRECVTEMETHTHTHALSHTHTHMHACTHTHMHTHTHTHRANVDLEIISKAFHVTNFT